MKPLLSMVAAWGACSFVVFNVWIFIRWISAIEPALPPRGEVFAMMFVFSCLIGLFGAFYVGARKGYL